MPHDHMRIDRELEERRDMEESLGKVAYEGYRAFSDGKSLVSGQPIPEWEMLSEPIQLAWMAAADAVVAAK